jgi:hypothetical protein
LFCFELPRNVRILLKTEQLPERRKAKTYNMWTQNETTWVAQINENRDQREQLP